MRGVPSLNQQNGQKNLLNASRALVYGGKEPPSLLVGMLKLVHNYENSMEGPQKLKIELPMIQQSWIWEEEGQNYNLKGSGNGSVQCRDGCLQLVGGTCMSITDKWMGSDEHVAGAWTGRMLPAACHLKWRNWKKKDVKHHVISLIYGVQNMSLMNSCLWNKAHRHRLTVSMGPGEGERWGVRDYRQTVPYRIGEQQGPTV